MNAGMLWFDNDPKTSLQAKIERAVDYYRHKYGRDPNLCLIHPTMVGPSPCGDDATTPEETPGSAQGQITVRPYRPVLPGHLWIGVEEKS